MRLARQVKILALTWLLCASALADTLKDPAAVRTLADSVMVKVGAGDMFAGLQIARPYFIIPAAEFDVMLGQVKLQQSGMDQRFGKSIGYEFILEDKVGANLVRLVYLHRFEKHAMRWSFYFYRGSTGWVLNTFKTDDDIRLLF